MTGSRVISTQCNNSVCRTTHILQVKHKFMRNVRPILCYSKFLLIDQVFPDSNSCIGILSWRPLPRPVCNMRTVSAMLPHQPTRPHCYIIWSIAVTDVSNKPELIKQTIEFCCTSILSDCMLYYFGFSCAVTTHSGLWHWQLYLHIEVEDCLSVILTLTSLKTTNPQIAAIRPGPWERTWTHTHYYNTHTLITDEILQQYTFYWTPHKIIQVFFFCFFFTFVTAKIIAQLKMETISYRW